MLIFKSQLTCDKLFKVQHFYDLKVLREFQTSISPMTRWRRQRNPTHLLPPRPLALADARTDPAARCTSPHTPRCQSHRHYQYAKDRHTTNTLSKKIRGEGKVAKHSQASTVSGLIPTAEGHPKLSWQQCHITDMWHLTFITRFTRINTCETVYNQSTVYDKALFLIKHWYTDILTLAYLCSLIDMC